MVTRAIFFSQEVNLYLNHIKSRGSHSEICNLKHLTITYNTLWHNNFDENYLFIYLMESTSNYKYHNFSISITTVVIGWIFHNSCMKLKINNIYISWEKFMYQKKKNSTIFSQFLRVHRGYGNPLCQNQSPYFSAFPSFLRILYPSYPLTIFQLHYLPKAFMLPIHQKF